MEEEPIKAGDVEKDMVLVSFYIFFFYNKC